MEMKLDENEVKAAVDFWLRQIHPTLMDKKVIGSMIMAQYPPSILLSIKEDAFADHVPIPAPDDSIPF